MERLDSEDSNDGVTIIEERWLGKEAAGLSGLDLLVYRSRLAGFDSRLVVWGGGLREAFPR